MVVAAVAAVTVASGGSAIPVLIGAGIGAGVGFGSSIGMQLATTGTVDWSQAFIDMPVGDVMGAFGGSAIGQLGMAIAGGVTGFGSSVAGDWVNGRDINWGEGQDIDCNNSVSGGTANITLSFNSYDLFLDENGNFIAKERFLTPTLSQESPTVFSWEPVATNVSSSTYSIDYLVLIQKSLESETIFIKAILTNQLSLDTLTISLLQSGEYFLSVKAISTDFGDSDYSNSVAFLI